MGINRGCKMTKTQLLEKIARLESINDQMKSEVIYIDHLMRLIGFSEGLVTVKATANEILEKGIDLFDGTYVDVIDTYEDDNEQST
jgi:hypothetical protein